jgi:integrase
MTDTRKWESTGTRGVYKQVNAKGIERFRVIYEAREIDGGKTVVKQRSKIFSGRKGERPYRITVGTDSERVTPYEAACDFKREVDRARGSGRVTDAVKDQKTLGQYWPEYLAGRTKKGNFRRPKTVDTMAGSYRTHIALTFGNTPLRAIKPSDVDAWFNGLKTGEPAKKKAAVTLRALFNKAIKVGLVDSNPVTVLDLPADEVRVLDVDEVLTDEQIETLKNSIDDRYRLMIDLLAGGLRIGEVLGLRRCDVNLKGDVTIRHTLSAEMVLGPPKTENSYRTLPLEHLRDAIQRHLGEYSQPGPEGYVFTGPGRKSAVQVNNWRRREFYPALEAAGLPKTVPHLLRHRIGWSLMDDGFTVDQVADWIGDTPDTIRKVYANHPNVKSKVEIAAHLAERYREANTKP